MQQAESKTAMDDIFFEDWAKRGPYVAGKYQSRQHSVVGLILR